MDRAAPSIDEIFFAALEAEGPDARAAYLASACGGDADLRRRVERMLAANSIVGSFLESPAPMPTVTADSPAPERPGMVIGPYKLLEPIGEGGMGTVYMAEQARPVRRIVALKVIKPGMDSRQVLARFEAERQALALMDHPNIAKVLDAGATEGGRPYFVMELVKGVPITRFCDERRLTPRERLELFIPVCRAVQHAHQKGIIHRDLKPSNVLVALHDGRPVPTVIDFGVAKATGQKLTEVTLFTGFGAVVGTPEYMSPEQAELNQLDIDTRSDVYSLGVLLYELLTGTTPIAREGLREAAILEILRVIREEEPPRPSLRLSTTEELPSIAANRSVEPRKLAGLVRGELDWIVMRALEKDRNRRYETASGLAADLRRYLDDEPVMACPPSAGYRLRKLARRNKGLLTAAAVVFLALVGGTAVATWQAVRAVRAEHRTALALAEARLQRQGARQAVDEMYTQVAEKWLAGQSSLTQLQREFLEKALAFYERFATADVADPQVRHDSIRALYRVGVIRLELGRHDEAETALRQVVGLGTDLVGRDPDRPEFRLVLAEGRIRLAALLRETGKSSGGRKGAVFILDGRSAEFASKSREGRTGEADQAVRQAVQDLAKLRATIGQDPAHRRRLAEAHDSLCRELTLSRQLPDAEAAVRTALGIWETLARDFPAEVDHRFGLAHAYLRLGMQLMWWGGQNEKAEAALRQAEVRLSGLLKDRPGDRRFREARGSTLMNLGVILSRAKRDVDAREVERQAVALFEGLVADFPDVPGHRNGLAGVLNNLGNSIERQGRDQEAEGLRRRSLVLYENLAERHPEVPMYESRLGQSFQAVSRSLIKQGKLEEARQLTEQGFLRAQAFQKAHPELEQARVSYRNFLVQRVLVTNAGGDSEAAVRIAGEWARLTLEEFTRDQLGAPVVSLCASEAESHDGDAQPFIQANHLLTKALLRESDRRGLDDPRALFRLADLMTAGPEELRDPELALRFARRSVEREPRNGMYLQSLGWALYRAGDLKGCIETLSEKDFVHCAFLAMAHWQSGDKDRARACYEFADRGLAGYEKRWKVGVHPTPTMLRRVLDEAAVLLGMEPPRAKSASKAAHDSPSFAQ